MDTCTVSDSKATYSKHEEAHARASSCFAFCFQTGLPFQSDDHTLKPDQIALAWEELLDGWKRLSRYLCHSVAP